MINSTPASEFVADTMGLVLLLEKRRLGPAAKAAFDLAEAGKAAIHVPGLVFGEILYLSAKGRIGLTLGEVEAHFSQHRSWREYPLDLAVVQAVATITDIPELHDKLIAGTGRLLNLELITNGPTIETSQFVRTIWD